MAYEISVNFHLSFNQILQKFGITSTDLSTGRNLDLGSSDPHPLNTVLSFQLVSV